MSGFVSVQIRRPVYQKLQRLAVLTGDESSAIERLISHWENSTPSGSQPPDKKAASEVQYWHSSRGDILQVGEILQGTDGRKIHQAIIERDGIRFPINNGILHASLSAAARAVKHARGLKGTSASTDGRKFWKVRDPKTNRWVPISVLRPAHKIDVEKLLAELQETK